MQKWFLLKLVLESGEGGMKENGRGGEFMIYLMHCNNLCKCHIVPPPITTIKEKNK
jgi:hypothetical protein